jgi:hypothetical protein
LAQPACSDPTRRSMHYGTVLLLHANFMWAVPGKLRNSEPC